VDNKLAILASHTGTTLQAVMDACANGKLNAQIALVISNNSNSGAMQRAQDSDIPTLHLSGKTHGDDAAVDDAMLEALNNAGVTWVLLLGYMKKLGPKTLAAFNGRIINTHPALLPKFGGKGFYGRKVHEAVIAAGETESGATIHLVDMEYDEGPKLSQVRVPVRPQDTVETLEHRVKHAEQKLLINTLGELVNRQEASNY
jgi:phosphoribosylglycinamide formyltransferase-1